LRRAIAAPNGCPMAYISLRQIYLPAISLNYYNLDIMASLLMIITHITVPVIVFCVARFVYKASGSVLLTALLTLFLCVFGTVSILEAGIAAHGDGLTPWYLLLFVIFQVILIPITLSAS
jgi:hypothetical protein